MSSAGGSSCLKADKAPRALPRRDLGTWTLCHHTVHPSQAPRPQLWQVVPEGGASVKRRQLRTRWKQAPPSSRPPCPLALQAEEESTAWYRPAVCSPMPLPGPLPWRCCLFQEAFLDSCQAVFPSSPRSLPRRPQRQQGPRQIGAPESRLAQGLPGQPGPEGPWKPPCLWRAAEVSLGPAGKCLGQGQLHLQGA